ncbi:MAG: cellulase family glycosylhydrolase [Abitibacteriaceae bacterium]|nr:cellulase family glycosylhydrolase [Abditibacteriaceae bacterium]MBV9865575.1 cellulase family glycosylhydrolase [Abditibacteriaceae bacterium]
MINLLIVHSWHKWHHAFSNTSERVRQINPILHWFIVVCVLGINAIAFGDVIAPDKPGKSISANTLERIVLSADGKGFIRATSKKPFRPWGVNYGNNGRLIEDFWDQDWQTVADDFHKIKQMGGNVVRVHLQFGKFMETPDKPRGAALQQLGRLLQLAQTTGLYLDLTGLACYRRADTPPWYDALSDTARWEAQAVFWRAIAAQCASSPAVFCYDLMNEPISPGSKADKWYTGEFGGYSFIQFIVRDPAGRTRREIATAWIDKLTAAIRQQDKTHLITVGMLPWVTDSGHISGIVPKEVAPHLDFLSVHIYPTTKQPAEATRALQECNVGKPVVIEETFPLHCSVPELETFLRSFRTIACGWVWHYDGSTVEQYAALQKSGKLTMNQAIWQSALQSFIRLQPEFVSEEKRLP